MFIAFFYFTKSKLDALIYSTRKIQSKNFFYRIYFSNLVFIQTAFSNILTYTVFSLLDRSNYILTSDYFFIFIYTLRLKYSLKHTRAYRHTISFNYKVNKGTMFKTFMVGFTSIWLSLRNWVLSVHLTLTVIGYLTFLKLSFFTIFIFKCTILFGIFYWLFAGFTFFLKKYRYRYFTSSLQRFWKRCFAIFWLLEFFLFFVYFLFNLRDQLRTILNVR